MPWMFTHEHLLHISAVSVETSTGTQAKGAAPRCSLWRNDELCMLKRCDVLAEVDNGDISSTHKPSVIGVGGGRGGTLQNCNWDGKMVGCAPECLLSFPFPYRRFQIEILIDVL